MFIKICKIEINNYMSIRNKSNANSNITQNGRTLTKRVSNGVAVYDNGSSSGSSGSGSGSGVFSGVAAILSCSVEIQSSRGTYYYTTPGTTDPLNFPIHGVIAQGAVFKNSSGGAMLISNVISDGGSTYIGRVASFNTSGYGTVGTWRDLSTQTHSYTYTTSTAANTAKFVLIPADAIFACEALRPDTASKGFNASGGNSSWAMIRSIGNVDADQIKAANDGGTLSTLLSDNNISGTNITNL